MKYLSIILLLISFNSFGQEFITDDNFDSKINQKQAFGDDQTKPVIVEFPSHDHCDAIRTLYFFLAAGHTAISAL